MATIVARKFVGPATTDHIAATYVYIADVQSDSDAATFRATFKEHFSGQFRDRGLYRPAVGDQTRVSFDAKRRNVKLDRAKLRADRDAAKHSEKASFDALASGPPGSGAASASGPNEGTDDAVEHARETWRQTLKQGWCTQEEFDREMRELDGL